MYIACTLTTRMLHGRSRDNQFEETFQMKIFMIFISFLGVTVIVFTYAYDNYEKIGKIVPVIYIIIHFRTIFLNIIFNAV